MNEIKDKFGNSIYRSGDNVFLELVNESRNRKLGRIKGTVIEMFRDPKKHLLYKLNAYGFNHNLLDRLNKVKEVLLSVESKKYLIPIKYILENGSFLNFKEQGFELQIFLEVEKIKGFEVSSKSPINR